MSLRSLSVNAEAGMAKPELEALGGCAFEVA
jgi:hypothetical protein